MDGDDRYSGSEVNDDKTIMNRVMLRFRPIAPKPVSDGSVSGLPDPELITKKRAKRKYVRVDKSVRKNSKAKERIDCFDETAVTLELLPEIRRSYSEREKSKDLESSEVEMDMYRNNCHGSDLSHLSAEMAPGLSVVESWVTVESLTDTCGLELEGRLGYTDEEKVRSLEADTCPGFVSDGDGGVRWMNTAYRRMVGEGDAAEVVVWLEMKERSNFVVGGRGAFSCSVRVVHGGRGKRKQTKTVPCDVWRMEFGGFAWRLDLQAGLTLSLGG